MTCSGCFSFLVLEWVKCCDIFLNRHTREKTTEIDWLSPVGTGKFIFFERNIQVEVKMTCGINILKVCFMVI